MRISAGAFFAAALTMAGAANATAYLVDVTAPPTIFDVGGRPGAFGSTSFPAVTLLPGDSLTIDVSYGETVPTEDLDLNFIMLNLGPDSTIDDGLVHLEYGGVFPSGLTGTGFTFSVSAESLVPDPPGDGSFVIDSISYDFVPQPEPTTWALIFTGLGIAGASLRRSRKTGAPRSFAWQ